VSDIIVKTLEEIKKKGKLKRTDVVIRYLRVKHKLILSKSALKKRIKAVVHQNSATNRPHPKHRA